MAVVTLDVLCRDASMGSHLQPIIVHRRCMSICTRKQGINLTFLRQLYQRGLLLVDPDSSARIKRFYHRADACRKSLRILFATAGPHVLGPQGHSLAASSRVCCSKNVGCR